MDDASYTIKWLLEGHIFIVGVAGEMPIAMLRQMDRDLNHYLDQAKGEKVHYVGLFTGDNHGGNLSAIKYFTFHQHPRLGWIVFYGKVHNPLWHMVIAILRSLWKINYAEFITLQEALRFLQEKDPAIPLEDDLTSLLEKAMLPKAINKDS